MNLQKEYDELINANFKLSPANNEKDLCRPDNLTKEERKRNIQITRLLEDYVEAYEQKAKQNTKNKLAILITSLIIICLLTIALISLLTVCCVNISIISTQFVATLISAMVAYVGLFVGILKIITAYVFPKNEEQYITEIVKLIQQNDLENKKEDYKNMHYD